MKRAIFSGGGGGRGTLADGFETAEGTINIKSEGGGGGAIATRGTQSHTNSQIKLFYLGTMRTECNTQAYTPSQRGTQSAGWMDFDRHVVESL